MLGSTNGYFVGDKEAQPLARFFGSSPALEAFPDAYVVRRSDMNVITSLNLNRSAGILPFVEMAENPDADWNTIMPPPFESICAEGDDEASEPNDDPASAGLLELGTTSGGICTEGADFYRVELEGAWRVRVEFSHSESDIDVAYFSSDNLSMPISVSQGTEDSEQIEGEGFGFIQVFSFNNSSTTYTITLEAL